MTENWFKHFDQRDRAKICAGNARHLDNLQEEYRDGIDAQPRINAAIAA